MASQRIDDEPIDEERLDEIVGMAVNELGAAYYAPLIVIGDRLGLYEALADGGPVSPAELAERTDTVEPYVTEWLNAGAAGGYVTYDPETGRYGLTPEQAALLADEDSPAFLAGGYQGLMGYQKHLSEIEAAFRTGEGVGWHEHDADVCHGTERFYRPSYETNLVDEWIPALDGMSARLRDGARVADVGCGHGASTIITAEAYPDSAFVGVDYHDRSIEVARERAEDAGVADRISFEVATAKEFTGADYDLVMMFDAYHDMGDPVGVASHVRETLADDGAWLLVEPFANDRLEENLNPVSRAFYCASTLACVPNSLDQGGDPVLGAQAGEARLRDVITSGGFTRVRRAAETPFNLVLEAKP
ncbi:methyltransferase domain-containing protein [Haloterrigena sp. SYSU A121-1]|uniref:Methyltransferase domain-containing protein n=1 Tax=Haloterrigena gelatinilytica TaxID=2741724 RepID=A0A8J8GJS1_9EURY|nr:methyltransferase domain-containing protein [Haloterrigena gelatinilytica]NUB91264.1 methyltransferase domain-containing protein [Haloterrigena gelatinilytica]